MTRPIRFVLTSAALAATIALAGCAPALPPVPATMAVQPALEWRTAVPNAASLEHDWWTRFGDSQMVTLVERARENNPDIRLAAARVEEARATEAVSRSLLLPTIEAGVSGGARREVSPFGQGRSSLAAEPAFRASYEVDLFGKNRANVDAAQAGVAASEASREAALLSVSAATASGYVTLLALDARRKVLSDTLELRRQALKFARDRAEVGYTSQLEWRQAQAEYQATAQLVPQIEAQIARQENALSVLTGEMPDDIVRGGSLAGLQQPPPPEVVPSQLLRLRPDIAAAEYQLAASNAQMRAARARFMPTLGLSASAGAAISDLLADPISIWSIGGSLLAPIFNGGRLQGQFDAATARRDQAAFAYRSTLLNAFREVEDRLAVLARLGDQQRALEAQRVAVSDALRHARNRYRAGYTPYIEQVDAQRNLLGVELSLVQLEADQINAIIGLYQAVGGAPDTRPRVK
ncbi:MAG: efflux transporter outer membrane subunit [Sphingomonadales bacterium]|nr:efflux transporter outer membrane subunit [Sphingomonadales bacterium]PIX67039.1 MAG: RND transporter [Sphingomonadales bacterium CG_4_10_14_3_um_filter_58_15]NCO49676.1 efflux transporter outer membrane subunit [Sphingomonadales bacterium]NCP00529.1 efflux transporter outer membrane subunit [Sphingomonadales bacterium]NCP26091.1 efflux transporter outer membrane subunit [Sphingomonadales bacterium]